MFSWELSSLRLMLRFLVEETDFPWSSHQGSFSFFLFYVVVVVIISLFGGGHFLCFVLHLFAPPLE